MKKLSSKRILTIFLVLLIPMGMFAQAIQGTVTSDSALETKLATDNSAKANLKKSSISNW